MSVHCSPAFPTVSEGDVVTVGQCRPLAKTVKFNVLEHQPAVNKVRLLTIILQLLMNFLIVRERQENLPSLLIR
jgi:hypothetical protein